MLTINEPVIPTERDVLMARESQRQIGKMEFGRKESVGVQIEGRLVTIPIKLAHFFFEAISQMANGQSVTMVQLEEEVSPQEAADILKVSRPFATKLFDEGAIPSRKVGTHRRALTKDVLAYKQREKEARLRVLDELSADAQNLKMGY